MTAEAYPLQWPEGWPRTPIGRRTTSKFGKSTGSAQIEKLQNELRLLGAKNLVISSNMALRQDGLPYASEIDRRHEDPGIAVYFTLRSKPLAMARDRYRTIWENLRSLILAIEAIRSIERHGGSTMMERAFSGFAAIAPPTWKKPWREVFGVKPDWSGDIKTLYREKARNCHPDTGGSDSLMAELNVAFDEAKRDLA